MQSWTAENRVREGPGLLPGICSAAPAATQSSFPGPLLAMGASMNSVPLRTSTRPVFTKG